ncbi:SUKH-4 family immunity protein [Streptomyces somaliensis]|uniref:SUKH-4 family immunity protein n=1 Tax=Streptomyces somaliensis TaxID=78355 RepID=UPI0020CFDE8A|nr:SUKH-4 family immunity protein [Streptomyces somaliensis]MCP9945044.1 SUKH-4 family immunity protein [Streptomyces somaliensis]MCP9961741.1 SUKH-4 family immunity protein [Streptomyces somaliensis]MCP9974556.1 SUKH-4 family immunity protein [Streptomyces somaliensis]
MLANISAGKIISTFDRERVTYYPRILGAHLHAPTAHFLSSAGLPENRFFSARPELADETLSQPFYVPSVKASFERDGAECPPEAETWEELGVFQYAMVALDPTNGAVYAFPEGEVEYAPMHADVSSFVHSLIVLEEAELEYKEIKDGDYQAYDRLGSRMKQQITAVDETPFAHEDSEWTALFEEIRNGMWK